MFSKNFFSIKKIKALVLLLMTVIVVTATVTQKVFAADAVATGLTAVNPVVGALYTAANASGAAGAAVSGLASGLGTIFMQVVSYILYFFLWIESFMVGLAGVIFNVVFDYTVVHISDFVQNAQIINTGWGIVRDLSNILFIFTLLYLAIATILQLDEHGVKHALSRLIIAAVLINFSLLFTKVIIDVPNLLAIKIYDSIKVEGGGGLGDAFMSIFNPAGAVTEGDISQAGVVGGFKKFTDGASSFANLKNPITTFAMGMILDMAIIFVFLAVIIIFLKRFVILIFLMIFSPLAFAGMAVHALEHDVKEKFWNTLIRESFYAPAFMLCIYITLKVGQAIVGKNISVNGDFTAWSEYINIPYIFGFAVVIMMSVASLIVAEEMGVSGAGQAMGAFNGMRNGFTGWVGSNTIGRAAHTIYNKGASATWIADASAGRHGLIMTYVGRGIGGTLSKAGKGFGEKVHTEETYKKAADEEHHNDPNERAKGLMNAIKSPGGLLSANLQSSDAQAHHWNAEEHANVKLALEAVKKKGSAAGASAAEQKDAEAATKALARWYDVSTHDGVTHYGRLTQDTYNKMVRAEFGELDHYNNQFKSILTDTHTTAAQKSTAISDFIKNAKSPGAVVGALKSSGEQGQIFNGTTADAKLLRSTITNALLNKFNSEAEFSNVAKDPVVEKELKAAVAAAGYEAKMTADLYDVLEKFPASRTNGAIRTRFENLVKKFDVPEIQTALLNYNDNTHADYGDIQKIMDVYKTKKLGDNRSTQNFFSKDNGKRSQLQSEEIVQALSEIQNEIGMFDPTYKV